ncbi:hypothetical protein Cni_G02892 [Canna indica]|uniref:Uncharacterized protein n=1 Tax=Canna indica TaxID=4628 RepID=A0AAQ3JTI7_9LILI|nr:hypothetical protein Cni_G02892 [Canna indica]
MPLGIKGQVNGKRHNFGEPNMSVSLLSNHEGKALHRDSDRKLSNCSYSKRPRIDQPESCLKNAHVDDVSTIMQKNVDLIRSTSADKARMLKSRRGLDGKKNDRKNFRSGTKTRYDTFTSKAGFAGTDTMCGGNNLLGIHGLKSDLSDVAKHVDDLRLSELLDGSYRYSCINAEKGKKLPIAGENIFVSMRKAFSILPQTCSTDSNGNRKTTLSHMKPSSSSSKSNCNQNDKDCDRSSSTKYPNSDDDNLYQPKEVLKRIALPPAQDLDSLLFDLSLSSCKSTLPKETCHGASLPPFSWSSTHTGACKPIADTGKQISTKNTSQGRWLRIDNTSLLAGDNSDRFLDWEQLTFDNDEDPQPRNSVLRDIGISNVVLPMSSSIESNTRDNKVVEKESCLSVSHTFRRLSLMEEQTNNSQVSLDSDDKDSSLLRTCDSEANLKFQGKDPHLLDQVRYASQFSNTEFTQKDLHTPNKHCCSAVCCFFPCKDTGREYDQSSRNLSTLEMSKPDYSLCEMHAAEILIEMTRCCNTLKNQIEDGGRTKWSKTSLQKTVKTQKLVSSVEKSESLLFRTRHHDPVKAIGLPYWDKPSEKKNDLSYMRSAGRVPMKCSGRLESGVFPRKIEKERSISARPLHSVTVRSTSLIPPVTRENGCENQQKLRKTTLTTSTLGACIKDWSRGRNKQD